MSRSFSTARWPWTPARSSATTSRITSFRRPIVEAPVRLPITFAASRNSKALTDNPMPKIIVSASGMATGGRVLHHLKRYAPDPRNTILFAGFQAGGTRGAAMMSGAKSVKIHGEYVPVHAEIRNLDMLSAHADVDELLRWLHGFKAAPRTTFVVHGEPAASDALRHRIEEELGWRCMVPDHAQKVELA